MVAEKYNPCQYSQQVPKYHPMHLRFHQALPILSNILSGAWNKFIVFEFQKPKNTHPSSVYIDLKPRISAMSYSVSSLVSS